jgi:hypothetical protein
MAEAPIAVAHKQGPTAADACIVTVAHTVADAWATRTSMEAAPSSRPRGPLRHHGEQLDGLLQPC